jgi:hypothetical protein
MADRTDARQGQHRTDLHEVSNWKDTVEPTVDAQGKINGGCRSLTADGKSWDCFLGEKAIEEQIIGPALLGAPSDGPGVG